MRIINNFQLSTFNSPLLVVLLLLLFAACQDEYSQAVTTPDSDEPAAVQLRMTPKAYTGVKTRAIANDDKLNSVTLLQFKRHKLIRKIEYTSGLTGNIAENRLVSMGAGDLDADGVLDPGGNGNVIVCLANFKAQFQTLLDALTVETTRYNDFQNGLTATLADATALAGLTEMPMIGYHHGPLIPNQTNTVGVELIRSLAKVNFTVDIGQFKVEGESPLLIEVQSIELCNVPRVITFVPTTSTYPAFSEDNFMTLTAGQNLAADDQKGKTFVAYMPPNAKGNYSAITHNKDKHPEHVGLDSDECGWTHIRVKINYLRYNEERREAYYKIYLGANGTDDVNMVAGYQYNINTKLLGINAHESIITLEEKYINPIVSVAADANCYMINKTTVPNDTLVFTTNQATAGWNWLKSNHAGDASAARYLLEAQHYLVDTLETLLTDPDRWSVELLWCTWDDFPDKSFDIETYASCTIYDKDQGKDVDDVHIIRITGLDKVPAGNNAVIALKDSEGKIWWSWHLWFTSYAPTLSGADNGEVHSYNNTIFKTGIYKNSVIMDRNLGATGSGKINAQPTTVEEAVKWYGLAYQWGRKDPFTLSKDGTDAPVPIYNANGEQLTSTSWIAALDDGDVMVTPTVIHAEDGFAKAGGSTSSINHAKGIRFPYIFLAQNNTWTHANMHAIWGSNVTTNATAAAAKTPFDPCPAGWRVPIRAGSTTIFKDFNGVGAIETNGVVYNADPFVGCYYGAGETTSALLPTHGRLYTGYSKTGSGSRVNAWFPHAGQRMNQYGTILHRSVVLLWMGTRNAAMANAYSMRAIGDPRAYDDKGNKNDDTVGPDGNPITATHYLPSLGYNQVTPAGSSTLYMSSAAPVRCISDNETW